MKEYIERDALLKTSPFTKCGGELSEYAEGYLDCVEDACKAVREAPAADVVPVVHCKDCQYKSEWIKNGYGEYFCRKSGLWNLSDVCFCHCGTRMDGGKENEGIY